MSISNELNEVFFRYPFSVPPFFALITRGLGLLEGECPFLALFVSNDSFLLLWKFNQVESTSLTQPRFNWNELSMDLCKNIDFDGRHSSDGWPGLWYIQGQLSLRQETYCRDIWNSQMAKTLEMSGRGKAINSWVNSLTANSEENTIEVSLGIRWQISIFKCTVIATPV